MFIEIGNLGLIIIVFIEKLLVKRTVKDILLIKY